MKPSALRKAAVELYGARGWQHQLASALKVDGSTVRRWISGAIPVPGPVEVAVQALVKLKRGNP